jgi:hypothetical protein
MFLQGCAGESTPEKGRDDQTDLDAFARQTLQVSNYRLGQADLNEDGADEILLYANGRESCGSGGCNLYVIVREPSGFRTISNITIANLPVRLLTTSHNGWRDIAVTSSLSRRGFHLMARAMLRTRASRQHRLSTGKPARS